MHHIDPQSDNGWTCWPNHWRETALFHLNLSEIYFMSLSPIYTMGLLDYTFCSVQAFYSCSLLLSIPRVILLLTKGTYSSIQELYVYHQGKQMLRVMYASTLPPLFFLGAEPYTTFPAPACSGHGRTPCTALMPRSEQLSATFNACECLCR